MIDEEIFENEQIITDAAIKRLRQRRTNLDVIKFNEPKPLVGEFPIADIKAGDPEGKLESWLEEKGLNDSIQSPALYVIEFVGDKDDLNKFLDEHGTEHDKKYDAKYDAKNDENKRNHKLTPKNKNAKDETKVLYVGKSLDIRKRLKEHLLGVSNTTTALNLPRWVPDIDGTLTVKVRTIRGEPDWLKKGVKNALKDVKDALKDLEKGALKDVKDALKDLDDALKDLEKDALRDLEDGLWHSLRPRLGQSGGR